MFSFHAYMETYFVGDSLQGNQGMKLRTDALLNLSNCIESSLESGSRS